MPVRLYDHVHALHADARDLLATGKVFYGGVPTADGGRLVDVNAVFIRRDAPRMRPGTDPAIIWRDPHFVVVYKPPGMLAVPAPHRRETNVLAFVGKLLGSAKAVHRIDEGTSGLMMVALTTDAQLALKELLERHDVERRYLAIVRGHFPPGEKRVESMLVRNRGDGFRGSGDDSGPAATDGTGEAQAARRAVTLFRALEDFGSATLVEARLETGRTHQVRIHLAEKGFPILGDPLYGDGKGAPRLALHAAVLGLKHPRTGQALRWEAPLADDLDRLIRDRLSSRRAHVAGRRDR